MTQNHNVAAARKWLAEQRTSHWNDTDHCEACGTEWPIYILDAKPEPPDNPDFNRLEGPCCYGPGYCTP